MKFAQHHPSLALWERAGVRERSGARRHFIIRGGSARPMIVSDGLGGGDLEDLPGGSRRKAWAFRSRPPRCSISRVARTQTRDLREKLRLCDAVLNVRSLTHIGTLASSGRAHEPWQV
jgi:hypothetical protein